MAKPTSPPAKENPVFATAYLQAARERLASVLCLRSRTFSISQLANWMDSQTCQVDMQLRD